MAAQLFYLNCRSVPWSFERLSLNKFRRTVLWLDSTTDGNKKYVLGLSFNFTYLDVDVLKNTKKKALMVVNTK